MKSITRPLAIAALPIVLSACSGMGSLGMMKAPGVPAAISVPSGNSVAYFLKGSGLLNYECRAKSDASGFDWVLASPDAVLRDKNDAIVGKYYGGPTWEHGDGSKVTGKQLATAPAPTAGNIPWQLVQAVPSPGSGALNGVTYIQRINTNAGVAPSDPCNAGSVAGKKQVRYSADYVFYKS